MTKPVFSMLSANSILSGIFASPAELSAAEKKCCLLLRKGNNVYDRTKNTGAIYAYAMQVLSDLYSLKVNTIYVIFEIQYNNL